MNAICVRCGRHTRYRLELGDHAKGLLCDCGGMIVKARIVDLFEFPTKYEPVNPTARAKLAARLAQERDPGVSWRCLAGDHGRCRLSDCECLCHSPRPNEGQPLISSGAASRHED